MVFSWPDNTEGADSICWFILFNILVSHYCGEWCSAWICYRKTRGSKSTPAICAYYNSCTRSCMVYFLLVFLGKLHTNFHKLSFLWTITYKFPKSQFLVVTWLQRWTTFMPVLYDEQVTSVRTIGWIASYCAQVTSGVELRLALAFFWKFTQHTISSQICNSEVMPCFWIFKFDKMHEMC